VQTCRQEHIDFSKRPYLAQPTGREQYSQGHDIGTNGGANMPFNHIQKPNAQASSGAPKRSSDFQHKFEQSLSEPTQDFIESSFRERIGEGHLMGAAKPLQAGDGANMLLYQQDHEHEVFVGSTSSSMSSTYSQEDEESRQIHDDEYDEYCAKSMLDSMVSRDTVLQPPQNEVQLPNEMNSAGVHPIFGRIGHDDPASNVQHFRMDTA